MIVFIAWGMELIPMTVKKNAASFFIIVSVLLHNGGILQRLHHKTGLALKSFKTTNYENDKKIA